MLKNEIRNQNTQRKWQGCRDVYLKSSTSLNYKSLLNEKNIFIQENNKT